ncbi:hypothetical protein ACNKHM_02470 [Shigella sonnei]
MGFGGDLNKGVIIQSGDDACIALADYVAGRPGVIYWFDEWLCQKTRSDQHYLPDGARLDAPGQFSTARDMALLGKAPDTRCAGRVRH